LRFVDDQDWAHHRGLDVLAPSLAQGFEASPAVVHAERHLEDIAELAIEVAGTALRMLLAHQLAQSRRDSGRGWFWTSYQSVAMRLLNERLSRLPDVMVGTAGAAGS
jgi:hypothetical protein